MSRILWRDAQGNDGAVDLGPGEMFVGRALECAIRTEDAMVSRHHARVFLQHGQYFIEDLGSSNGVYFQEQRVARHPLRHGDAVRCGSLWLRFIDERQDRESPAGPAQPAPGPAGPAAAPREPVGVVRNPPHEPADGHDARRLHRRAEPPQAEPRSGRGDGARSLEALEDEVARLSEERDRFRARTSDLEARLAAEGGDGRARRAGALAHSAAEVVAGLNDVLSNLRINVMAAEGEFEQFASALPRASFELIREALRSSGADVNAARELLRKLRGLS